MANNTLGIILVSIIGMLFFIGTGSILISLFYDCPTNMPHKLKDNKKSTSLNNISYQNDNDEISIIIIDDFDSVNSLNYKK